MSAYNGLQTEDKSQANNRSCVTIFSACVACCSSWSCLCKSREWLTRCAPISPQFRYLEKSKPRAAEAGRGWGCVVEGQIVYSLSQSSAMSRPISELGDMWKPCTFLSMIMMRWAHSSGLT